MLQCFVGKTIGGGVDPDEVGAFRFDEFHFRKVFGQVFPCEIEISSDIFLHRVQPFPASFVGGAAGGKAHDVQLVVAEGVQFFLEGAADVGVRNEDVGVLEAGDVEGFGGGGADDGALGRFFADGAEGGVGMAGVGEVFVDFIGHDFHAVGQADVRIFCELFFGPYAAHRVVGCAEEGELHISLHDFFFQVFEINFIMAVLQHQGAVHQSAAVFDDRIEEGVVYRLVDEDAVAGPGEGFHGDVDGGNYAGGLDEPFRLDGPVEIGFLPVCQGFEIGLPRFGVAEDAVLHPLFQGVKDGLGHFEVHVRHPEGQHVRRFSTLSGKIVFQAAASAAVDDGI